jgi:hypothetical protein
MNFPVLAKSPVRLLVRILLAAALLHPVLPAHAEEEVDASAAWEEGVTTGRTRVFFREEYFTWREYDGGRRLLEETGPRQVLGVDRVFNREDITFAPSFEFMFGTVDYDGHTQDGTPATTDVEYRGFTLAGDGGKIFRFSSGGTLEPHLSLAWESWRRDIKSSGIAIGYVEKWDSFLARGGLRGEIPLGGSDSAVRLHADGGVEWPFATNNAVNFPGVSGEVTVHPKGQPWPYGEVGISILRGSVTAAYHGMRFDPSNPVDIGGGLGLLQPESQADVYSVTGMFTF